MNLKYMMLKDRYVFSYGPQMSFFGEEDEKKRAKQISLYLKELTLYNVSLTLLIEHTPSDKIKNELLNIAIICAQEQTFYETIRASRKLPIKKLSEFTYKSRSFVEKWQYYILAYFILLSNTNYYNLKSYLNIKNLTLKNTEDDVVALQILSTPSPTKNNFTGVILKVMKHSVFILSPQGFFIKLKPHESDEKSVGNICSGTIKKDITHFKYPIILSSICLFMAIVSSVYIYTKPTRTILIEGNSSIKIKTNRWDKVVKINSLNANGKKITESLSLFNKSIDNSIYILLKSAYEKKIISESTPITIFISSEKKESPDFNKSSAYISEHKLKISINNNGNEHKLKKP
jgi:hypothetical protein